MSRIVRFTIVVALLAVSGLTVGCCDAEKKQIASLTEEYNKLSTDNQDLRDQLVAARTRESQLISQVDSKTQEALSAQGEAQRLRQQLAAGTTAPPTPPTPPPGGETTVFKETVGSDVLFSSGRATLTSSGTQRMASIAARLNSDFSGMTVRVYGYTDSDPIRRTKNLWQDNLDLSANRAMAVTRYLRSKGINAERIETVAMGATHFVAANSSKAGKAKNRRVEIVVIK